MVHPACALFGPAVPGGVKITETHRKRLESVNFDPLISNFAFPKPPEDQRGVVRSLKFGLLTPGTFGASSM